jgi:hypothetical protein
LTTSSELVVLVVYLLGGDQRPIDTEDVAVRVNQLAPGRFTWSKYPDQINLELVRVFLSDAKKGDTALVAGSGRTGWTLTPAGLRWASQNATKLLKEDVSRERDGRLAGSVDQGRWRRERARVRATTAWAKWSSGDNAITAREARDVFRMDLYAVARMRDIKVARLMSMFDEQSDLGPFIRAMANAVSSHEEKQ